MKKENPPPSTPDEKVASRRGFLFKTIAIVPAASALTTASFSPAIGQTPAGAAAASGTTNATYQPRFFNADEWTFIKAAVDRLIPADNEGPGALELNVPAFIDGQMESGFGHASNWYMQGPFKGDASPLFGYQASMPPRELYRSGIAALTAYCRKNFGGKSFDQLAANDQEQLFKDMDGGKVQFESVSAQWFFTFLLQNTKEGYLSDPIHGGNKDMAAWKMIGFPGARADFLDFVGPSDKVYPYGPVGIGGKQS
jgi:gluconate 2-dehydrogenase gamma chain